MARQNLLTEITNNFFNASVHRQLISIVAASKYVAGARLLFLIVCGEDNV
jgi:hypothetical protein